MNLVPLFDFCRPQSSIYHKYAEAFRSISFTCE